MLFSLLSLDIGLSAPSWQLNCTGESPSKKFDQISVCSCSACVSQLTLFRNHRLPLILTFLLACTRLLFTLEKLRWKHDGHRKLLQCTFYQLSSPLSSFSDLSQSQVWVGRELFGLVAWSNTWMKPLSRRHWGWWGRPLPSPSRWPQAPTERTLTLVFLLDQTPTTGDEKQVLGRGRRLRFHQLCQRPDGFDGYAQAEWKDDAEHEPSCALEAEPQQQQAVARREEPQCLGWRPDTWGLYPHLLCRKTGIFPWLSTFLK